MNKRRGCSRRIVVALSVLAIVACVVLGISGLLYYRLQRARAQNEPPSVMITDPADGASTLAGSYLPVSATAFGGIPITRAELWVDGELVDTQESRVAGGMSPFDVSFDLLVSQGLHTVFVRAVNAVGLIGDSWSVGIGGVEWPGPDEPARVVTVGADETLEDIATAYDANPETVRQLNPDLGGQQPAAGSTVVLPPPQSKAQPGAGGPSVGPTVPPSGGPPAGGGTLPPPAGPPLQVIPPSPLPVDVGGLVGAVVDLWAAGAPAAPTNLQAEVTDCKVRLRWNDNANNEQRYDVWYLWNIGQAPRLIAKLNPGKGGQVWYEFPAPSSGAFIFWVDAVNSVGKQSSNKVAAMVGLSCGQTLAKELQVEALDMTVPAGYSQVYCYVSFEGAPHVKIPAGINDFMQVTGGKADIAFWASGNKKLVIPIPGDDSLEVEGDCGGWSGGKWSMFGTFGGKYARATWDGQRRALPGKGFEIGIAIKPLGGALDTSGLITTYSYEDPTLPAPYDVDEHQLFSPWPLDPLVKSLSWKWDGDSSKITGFQILLNGALYSSGGWSVVSPGARYADVRLPGDCAMHITWQVRAVAGQGVSKLSALKPENDYQLPTCPVPMYAMVKFDKVTFMHDCDDLDVYWFLRLNGITKSFGASCDPVWPWAPPYCAGGWIHIDDNCGPHSLASLAEGSRDCTEPYCDTVVAALGQTAIGGGSGPISIEIEDGFWNTLILTGSDDNIGIHRALYEFPTLQEAQEKLGCGREICMGPSTGDPYATEYAGYRASVCYTLYIFPQAEGSNCAVKQPAYTEFIHLAGSATIIGP